jgi:hypothetical protein
LVGSKLNLITSISIDGLKSAFSLISDTEIELTIPVDLVAGIKDLVIDSTQGRLTVQAALRVGETRMAESKTFVLAWTKRNGDSKVRFYAKNIVGAGKVQFFLNGKEIAWINATSTSDAKLRIASDASYLVRDVTLVAGQKNVLEVYVNGERIKRSAYTG